MKRKFMWTEFSADARQFGEDALMSLESALAAFRVRIYEDPRYEGSDQYGFILTRAELTSAEVKELVKEDA